MVLRSLIPLVLTRGTYVPRTLLLAVLNNFQCLVISFLAWEVRRKDKNVLMTESE